jgi:ribosomal protein S18 acetylase RimI-like enzyme
MSDVTIRTYQAGDEPALLQLWNLTLTHDPIDERAFRTRVLLDLNFRPGGLWLAEAGERPVGFVLSVALQGLEPERGWITAFGVHPDYRRRGLATRLFASALAGLERREVWISLYTPNYFTPGVDTSAYPAALAFLQATGWETVSRPISMRAELTGFQVPGDILALEERLARDHQVEVRPVGSADLPDLMPFIAENFGWDWVRLAREYLLELFGPGSDEIAFWVARQGPRLVGYCQQRRERFGPFGVAPDARRLGIGRLLLFRCLAAMLARGFHCAWFLWTGRDAARLYALAGFHPVREFAVLRRPPPPAGEGR